MFAWILGLVD